MNEFDCRIINILQRNDKVNNRSQFHFMLKTMRSKKYCTLSRNWNIFFLISIMKSIELIQQNQIVGFVEHLNRNPCWNEEQLAQLTLDTL